MQLVINVHKFDLLCMFIKLLHTDVFQVHAKILIHTWGTAVAQWLKCCATNRKVAGSIPDGIIEIFHSYKNSSDRSMVLGSTQPLTEMSTRSIS
jgi:hypothetical protein